MEFLDRGSKEYLIYMDAEFQTFRSPIDNDGLFGAGFVHSRPFSFTADDRVYYKYQFLLNLGFVIIDKYYNRSYFMVSFPSLFGEKPYFNDATVLEPDYTVASVAVVDAMKQARTDLVPKFSFFSTLKTESAKNEFKYINSLYQSDYTFEKEEEARQTLWKLITYAIPQSKFCHKGYTDMDAIANTSHYYGFSNPVYNSRNIDSIKVSYEREFQYFGSKKLESLQEFLVSRDDDVRQIRDQLVGEVIGFLQAKYGEQGVIKAHNPLIDTVYTVIVDMYLKKYFGDNLTIKA